jgi:hypothetical protein
MKHIIEFSDIKFHETNIEFKLTFANGLKERFRADQGRFKNFMVEAGAKSTRLVSTLTHLPNPRYQVRSASDTRVVNLDLIFPDGQKITMLLANEAASKLGADLLHFAALAATTK